jgi:hypothetical protein
MLGDLEKRLRRRLGSAIWKQWNRGSICFGDELRSGPSTGLSPARWREVHMARGGWQNHRASITPCQCLIRLARDSEIGCWLIA